MGYFERSTVEQQKKENFWRLKLNSSSERLTVYIYSTGCHMLLFFSAMAVFVEPLTRMPSQDFRGSTNLSESHETKNPEVKAKIKEWTDPDGIQNADQWNFDVFKFVDSVPSGFLAKLAGHILVQTRVIDQLQLDREKLYNLFEDVESSYHASVPYHNAVHATDVLQGVYYALRRPSEGFRLLDRLTPDETFSLVLAALGHDVNHMGRTNHFLRSSDHHLAKVNGDSPNESMHYRIFIQKVYKWKILDDFTPERKEEINENIKELIMATNMDHHAQILATWREKSKNFSFNSHDSRLSLMKYVLKFADISNPARPKELYDHWTKRLREELHQEGDEMTLLGMEVDSTRNRNVPSTVAKIQCWFIENRVQLYLRNIKQVGVFLSEPEGQLKQNLNQWRLKQTC